MATLTEINAKGMAAFGDSWTKLMDKMDQISKTDDPKLAKKLEMEMKQLEQIFKSIDAAINSLLNAETTIAQAPRG
ncbi:hypothetical protein D3C72_557640 [compost metagenome]